MKSLILKYYPTVHIQQIYHQSIAIYNVGPKCIIITFSGCVHGYTYLNISLFRSVYRCMQIHGVKF